MWKSINIAISTILLAVALQAQQVVVQQPDCVIFYHFTAAGQTSPNAPNAGFSNLTNGCTTWNVSYSNTGFTALSLVFQSAPNVSGIAGAWSTFAGATFLSGVNPNTNTTGAFTWLTGYNPWVRMTLASASGSGEVDGAVYGYRIPSAGNAGGVATSNVNVNQIGGAPASGCTNQALFNLSGSGNSQIIALSGTTSVRICHISFSTTASEDVKLTQGTGANCGGATADLTGLYKSVLALALNFDSAALLTGTSGDAICINQSNSQALGGIVIYAQF